MSLTKQDLELILAEQLKPIHEKLDSLMKDVKELKRGKGYENLGVFRKLDPMEDEKEM